MISVRARTVQTALAMRMTPLILFGRLGELEYSGERG